MSSSDEEVSSDITTNALRIQALHLLNDAIDKDRNAALSKSLLRNRIMMLWMAEPANKDYPLMLSELDKKSTTPRLASMFRIATMVKDAVTVSDTTWDQLENNK